MGMKILVEVSARHMHVTPEHLAILFGKDHPLTFSKELSQPGEFASKERVTLVGPRKELPNLSILGPARSFTQIELAATDARSVGIAAPIRESGDIKGSAPCKLVGPAGEVELTEGVIQAKRHIHITEEDAKKAGVTNNQTVKVSVKTPDRSLIFDDVFVRVSDKYATAMHIDTDEGNAAGIGSEPVYGEIIL